MVIEHYLHVTHGAEAPSSTATSAAESKETPAEQQQHTHKEGTVLAVYFGHEVITAPPPPSSCS